MRDLYEDTYTVAYLSGGVLACSVLELLNDRESVIKSSVFFPAVDVYYESDAACIMLLLHLLVALI